MKTQKGTNRKDDNDELRKPRRLEPNHKSGKERVSISHHHTYIDEDDEYIPSYTKRESAMDYYDDDDSRVDDEDLDEDFDEEAEDEEYDEEESDDEFEEEEFEEDEK